MFFGNLRKNNNLKQSGFTLLEMMISLTIFIILLVSLVNIFLFSQRGTSAIQDKEKVYSEGRTLLEKISYDIRSNILDYSDLWPGESAVKELRLTDTAGQKWRYQIGGAACPAAQPDCLLLGQVAGANVIWSVVNSDRLSLAGTRFYIYPLASPDTLVNGQFTVNIQPRVTLFFKFTDAANSQNILTLQTAVTSRVYSR